MAREQQIREAAGLYAWRKITSFDERENTQIRKEAFIAGAEYADNHRWISVKDSLPEIDRCVLVYFGQGSHQNEIMLSHRSKVSGKFVHIDYDDITHWMPISTIEEDEL